MTATTHTAVSLFAEYRRDHQAALEPCLMCMFAKCPEAEQDKLDALLEVYLDDSPRPPYSPVQVRRIMEKMQPLYDRAMQDPAVMAAEDQRDARWRDTPRWRKVYLRTNFMLFALKMRLRTVGRRSPWE